MGHLSEKLPPTRGGGRENHALSSEHLEGGKVEREGHSRASCSIVGVGRVGGCGAGCVAVVGRRWL